LIKYVFICPCQPTLQFVLYLYQVMKGWNCRYDSKDCLNLLIFYQLVKVYKYIKMYAINSFWSWYSKCISGLTLLKHMILFPVFLFMGCLLGPYIYWVWHVRYCGEFMSGMLFFTHCVIPQDLLIYEGRHGRHRIVVCNQYLSPTFWVRILLMARCTR
jgi:hypothetical protein